jgi:hypothetical protein
MGRDPDITHQSLRWRLDHTAHLGLGGSAVLAIGVLALWLGWWVLLRVLMGISRGLVDPRLEQLLIVAPLAGTAVEIAVAATVRWWNWTDLHADPHELALRGPLRTRRWAWADIRRIRTTSAALVVETAGGPVFLDRGSSSPAVLDEVVSWLETARVHGVARVADPPPPSALEDLRHRR